MTKLQKAKEKEAMKLTAERIAEIRNAAGLNEFQARVRRWMFKTFGMDAFVDLRERDFRFLEEALELAQANGMTRAEVDELADYVFRRPAGAAKIEAGDVMITLAALCEGRDFDLGDETARRFRYVDTPEARARIRAKQASKPNAGPLPGSAVSETNEMIETFVAAQGEGK